MLPQNIYIYVCTLYMNIFTYMNKLYVKKQTIYHEHIWINYMSDERIYHVYHAYIWWTKGLWPSYRHGMRSRTVIEPRHSTPFPTCLRNPAPLSQPAPTLEKSQTWGVIFIPHQASVLQAKINDKSRVTNQPSSPIYWSLSLSLPSSFCWGRGQRTVCFQVLRSILRHIREYIFSPKPMLSSRGTWSLNIMHIYYCALEED